MPVFPFFLQTWIARMDRCGDEMECICGIVFCFGCGIEFKDFINCRCKYNSNGDYSLRLEAKDCIKRKCCK